MASVDLHSKKSLKWLRSRIENFNNAVPYQVNALSTFRSNIRKQFRLVNFAGVRQERSSAERTIRNSRQLLIDVDKLREQVIDCDINKFDSLVRQSREQLTIALDNFNRYYESLSLGPSGIKRSILTSNDENPEVQDVQKQKTVLLEIEEDKWVLEEQIQRAIEIENIQRDTKAIQEVFCDLAKIINDQKQSVDHIENQIEESHVQVQNAQKELVQVTYKLQGVGYPLVGALIGSILGGPVGFLAGVKIGAVCAVSGSVIGFSGGSVLKKRQQKMQKQIVESIEDRAVVS